MQELSRNKEQLVRREVPKAEALRTFTEKGDQYKVELISDLEDGTISFYTNGAFTDLCRGPHIPNTGYIKALKLTSVAGAYWRGNEKNKMLTRIYGISFPKKSMLDEYLKMMEEAKKRDHRKLGKDLELFCFSQRVGQGLPLWLPRAPRCATGWSSSCATCRRSTATSRSSPRTSATRSSTSPRVITPNTARTRSSPSTPRSRARSTCSNR